MRTEEQELLRKGKPQQVGGEAHEKWMTVRYIDFSFSHANEVIFKHSSSYRTLLKATYMYKRLEPKEGKNLRLLDPLLSKTWRGGEEAHKAWSTQVREH